MPERRTYKDWLHEFTQKISGAYEKQRLDKQLAGYIHDVSEPAEYLPKGSGPFGAFIIGEGEELPPPYVISSQSVTPINIGFSLNISEWAEDPNRHFMDVLMSDIGRILAQREAFVIIKSMIDKAGRSIEVKERGQLTKTDLLEAQRWIKTQGFYADTVILHPKQETAFRIRGELVEASRIPVLAETKGLNFSGIIDGLEVYWVSVIGGVALVYKKSEIIVAKTPLKVKFDDIRSPSQLVSERWCSAAPVDERGVVKIII